MADLHEGIHQIESAIYKLSAGGSNLEQARDIIRDSLQSLAQIKPDSSLSLADTFEAIAIGCASFAKRGIGAVSIRLVCFPNLLPEECLGKGRRHIVRLIEEEVPELLSHKKAQTHEKLESVNLIHRDACDRLEYLRQPFTNLQDLIGRRQTIMKELNHGPAKKYLNVFGFGSVRASVSSLLSLVDKVVQSQGKAFQANMHSLEENINENLNQYSEVPTFIVREYMLPFLQRAQIAASEFRATMATQFKCKIVVPASLCELEKKYPLHVTGSQIHIPVPLTNEGPGVAQNVRSCCVTDHCDMQSEEIRLGNVSPGPFVLPLIVKVTEPRESIELVVEIQWDAGGDPSKYTLEFSVMARGQRTDLDWDELSLTQPYSLEVAAAKEFYGRRDAVQRILRSLELMQSCYITGQKRVGKSSLARAVEAHIRSKTPLDDYHYCVLYLECGEIRHSSGKETMRELGSQLEEFLSDTLPKSVDWTPKEYSSSLTPLNRLLNQLRTHQPETRFVVILDEFDEINEDLYRYGELANTFFLNLRTLSSKSNMAFVLVGAERMPHVMASQGEKLNKFSRESLDSFNLETEWSDYCALVQTPVEGVIKLHHAAIRKLFDLTNGHPYFTKVLCAKVYECAVEAKDAEVSSVEIEKAAQRVVGILDVNAFAHYWRDGIRGDSNQIEIDSLKRCRLLVAWARTSRSKKPLTCEAIRENVHSVALSSEEVLPLLEDFCRRGIFQEQDGVYLPSVDLFRVWLQEGGFQSLVSDQLGDELAEAKQHREDAAYVRSDEVVNVVNDWGLYQGRQITAEQVRAWIGQVESNVDQRLLFKLLQNIRFFHDNEVREKFSEAHTWIHAKLPVPVKKSRAQRRDDILVSFADGLGKSGAHYAGLYARTNEIVSENVVAPSQLGVLLGDMDNRRQVGLVIVDDMIGTGDTLVERLSVLSDVFGKAKVGTEIPLSVVVLCSTVEGECRVRNHIVKSMPNADLEICEMLDPKHIAVGKSAGFWETEAEKSAAKTMLTDLGARVQKRKPLGYGNQGLLLTFSLNCPNNSLPILHGAGKGSRKWMPLFPRTKM